MFMSKNDKIILIFSITKKMKSLYFLVCCKYRKFEKPIIALEKNILSIICSKCKNEDDKYLKKKKNQLKLKIVDLIQNV